MFLKILMNLILASTISTRWNVNAGYRRYSGANATGHKKRRNLVKFDSFEMRESRRGAIKFS